MEDKERIAVLETKVDNVEEDIDSLKGCFKDLCKEIKDFHAQINKWIRWGIFVFAVVAIELRLNITTIVKGVFT